MKRLLLWLGAVAILGGLVVVGLGLGIGFFLSPQDKLHPADAIVAISGGQTEARAEEAIKVYKDGYAGELIFSGAALDTSGPSNARAMEEQALAEGIDAHKILLDESSQNTSQNAENVAKIIKDHQYRSIILVTAPYHQRRAYISFSRALGPAVNIINHSAIDQDWRRSGWWKNPRAYSLTLAELQKTLYLLLTGSK